VLKICCFPAGKNRFTWERWLVSPWFWPGTNQFLIESVDPQCLSLVTILAIGTFVPLWFAINLALGTDRYPRRWIAGRSDDVTGGDPRTTGGEVCLLVPTSFLTPGRSAGKPPG